MNAIRYAQAVKDASRRDAAFKRCSNCEHLQRRMRDVEAAARTEREQHLEREASLNETVDELVERCRALEAQNDALLARLGEPRRDPVRERLWDQRGNQ